MKMKMKMNTDKIAEIIEAANIPRNDGEQFISVYLRLGSESGFISYGLNWKSEFVSEWEFSSLEDALKKVKHIRMRANLEDIYEKTKEQIVS